MHFVCNSSHCFKLIKEEYIQGMVILLKISNLSIKDTDISIYDLCFYVFLTV